jgi:hypothetical protein
MDLGSKDMGSRSFQGQNSFSGGYGEILEFLEWSEGLGAKIYGLLRNLGIFKRFLWIFVVFRVVLDLCVNIF